MEFFSKVIETNILPDLNGNDETNKIAFYVENVNWDFVKILSSLPRTNFSFLGGGGGGGGEEGSVVCRDETKGTLSKDDDDGSENVAKKMDLRSFKLNRVYLDPLNMSNAGDLSWS